MRVVNTLQPHGFAGILGHPVISKFGKLDPDSRMAESVSTSRRELTKVTAALEYLH